MIRTLDEANALLARCSYKHPWAERVTWQADLHKSGPRYMMSITYHQHPDTTLDKHHDSFTAGSFMLGESALFSLPTSDEQIIQMAYRLLLAVEEHEVGERFTVDEAAVFHPHANPDGTWCRVLHGTTWKNELNVLEPQRESAPFDLADRLRRWRNGFK